MPSSAAESILTLTPDDLHPEGRMVVPGLHVEPQEPRLHRVLQVALLHAVAVDVAGKHLS